MSVSGIQGQLLQVTVAGCTKLKDTEWISRQDPYVCVEYGSQKCRTRTCKDGGKNPTFQEKFMFTLIEGLREISVGVWNSNTLSSDDFIGNGKIQLHKVLSQGFDDTTSPLQTKTGRNQLQIILVLSAIYTSVIKFYMANFFSVATAWRAINTSLLSVPFVFSSDHRYAGEVRLIMHYANASKAATGYASSAPPCVHPVPGVSLYNGPPSAHGTPHAQPPSAYPVPSPYPSCPPDSSYPPSAYPPPQPTAYPPAPYPEPSAYRPPPPPPPPQTSPYYPPPPYPPPPQTSPYYPPGN
ncbi:hypothetical protein DKX38_014281 [Salix brachista]|uniref:C2 domain-containing protein n=2 Tax=Salix TaxID=40685 RepID=A0A5N5LEX8_9ROSI|nr:hypothetical protein DKX38_014281 [Salix brachista]